MSDPVCRNCLKPLLPTDAHCPHCGEPAPKLASVTKSVAKIAVSVIIFGIGLPVALFIGTLGGCLTTATLSFGGAGALGACLGIVVFGVIAFYTVRFLMNLNEEWWKK